MTFSLVPRILWEKGEISKRKEMVKTVLMQQFKL